MLLHCTFIKSELKYNIIMNERINIYNKLVELIQSSKTPLLFFINGGEATLSLPDDWKEGQPVVFSHNTMGFDITIAPEQEGVISDAWLGLMDWEDSGDYYDIRVVTPVYITK